MGAVGAMDSSDGLCLSQKLSQVSLAHHHYLHQTQHSYPCDPFGSVAAPTPSVAPPSDELLSSRVHDDNYLIEDHVSSQDFFCTPDFLTPVEQQFSVDFDGNKNKENTETFPSPLKCSPIRSKRPRPDSLILQHSAVFLKNGSIAGKNNEPLNSGEEASVASVHQLAYPAPGSYAPPNSRATVGSMRRRALSPPCIKNPFSLGEHNNDIHEIKIPLKQVQWMPVVGATCISRYREEFKEIQEIGRGHFSSVFKVLKRIDGCLYAVKRVHRELRQDFERRQALTEVQALAALGYHENIVRYHTAWFENDHLYIQMELCDGSLKNCSLDMVRREKYLLDVVRQIAQGLTHLHRCGLAHVDVKPDNIYISRRTFKLGDFGRATRLDGSISVEEGDAHYMPFELLNDDYTHLPKADVFALGASIYELARNSPLSLTGSQFQAIRQGRLALLPGFSLPFQNLLKNMMHPDPQLRPSAMELLNNNLLVQLPST